MLARSFNNDFVRVRKGSDSRALSRHASAVRTLMMNGRWIWVLINIYSFIDIIFTETIPGKALRHLHQDLLLMTDGFFWFLSLKRRRGIDQGRALCCRTERSLWGRDEIFSWLRRCISQTWIKSRSWKWKLQLQPQTQELNFNPLSDGLQNWD